MRNAVLLFCVFLFSAAVAAEWKNLDAEHYLGGRKASSGYLQGKVVLVDRWGAGCPPCRALLPRVEELWRSFKAKQFVVLGGHCKGWGDAARVKKLIDDNKLTYPVYEDAGLAAGEPQFNAIPFLYVVDPTGKVIYRGHSEQDATQALVTALTDWEAPKDLAQWQRFLDYEIEKLPAHAFLRLKAFKKKFPKEAKAYEAKAKEIAALADVAKVAELVAFAKTSKDHPSFGKKDGAKRKKLESGIKSALTKYAPLKENADARLAQEAKNSLADLTWTLADL